MFDIYIDIVVEVLIFDNSFGNCEFIAKKIEQEEMIILDIEKFNRLKNSYEQ